MNCVTSLNASSTGHRWRLHYWRHEIEFLCDWVPFIHRNHITWERKETCYYPFKHQNRNDYKISLPFADECSTLMELKKKKIKKSKLNLRTQSPTECKFWVTKVVYAWPAYCCKQDLLGIGEYFSNLIFSNIKKTKKLWKHINISKLHKWMSNWRKE